MRAIGVAVLRAIGVAVLRAIGVAVLRAIGVAVLCLWFLGVAFAASKTHHSADLKHQQQAVHNRIGELQQDVWQKEAAKRGITKQLKAVDAAIAAADQRLNELNKLRSALQSQLDDLERQSSALSRQIDAQQQQLSTLLYHQFVHGDHDALHLLISGEDPNQSARDRYFVTLLSRDKADLLGDMRATLQEKERLAAASRNKREELKSIETQQTQARAALLSQQRERQTLITQLDSHIKSRRQQIETLKNDERRLGSLIDNLARAARTGKHRHRGRIERPETGPRNPAGPDLSHATGEFAALRGKLQWPVRGAIAGKFGSPRSDSGTTWKGLFIQAKDGSEVHAVADGIVVFADWLRGFGNLLILDHGDGFLSVYGNNQSLSRAVGKSVTAGETIATVGSANDNEQSGLYFELRHQGQPFDPLRWIGLK